MDQSGPLAALLEACPYYFRVGSKTVMSYKRSGDVGEDRVCRYLLRIGMRRRWVKRGLEATTVGWLPRLY